MFALLAKPLGGTRPLAQTPLLYRLWSVVVSSDIKSWSLSNTPAWDTACIGSSALTAASHRQWMSALTHVTDNEIISLQWDIDKYFDSIFLEQVYDACVRHQYPMKHAVLALGMHGAPRVLQSSSVLSPIMVPGRSILQGCMQSMDFAKLIMHKPMERVHKDPEASKDKSTHVVNSTFVD